MTTSRATTALDFSDMPAPEAVHGPRIEESPTPAASDPNTPKPLLPTHIVTGHIREITTGTTRGATQKPYIRARITQEIATTHTIDGTTTTTTTTRTRTIMAVGAAYEATRHLFIDGNKIAVLAIYERAPPRNGQTTGGEFITIVGLPR